MNEYQQNKAIVRLIQVLNALLKGRYSMEQIAQQVFELFPYIGFRLVNKYEKGF